MCMNHPAKQGATGLACNIKLFVLINVKFTLYIQANGKLVYVLLTLPGKKKFKSYLIRYN